MPCCLKPPSPNGADTKLDEGSGESQGVAVEDMSRQYLYLGGVGDYKLLIIIVQNHQIVTPRLSVIPPHPPKCPLGQPLWDRVSEVLQVSVVEWEGPSSDLAGWMPNQQTRQLRRKLPPSPLDLQGTGNLMTLKGTDSSHLRTASPHPLKPSHPPQRSAMMALVGV